MTGERREEREREEEEKIMPSLMATSLRWRTHSARTKSNNGGEKIKKYGFLYPALAETIAVLRVRLTNEIVIPNSIINMARTIMLELDNLTKVLI